MSTEDDLLVVAATEIERMRRLADVGDWGTAGGMYTPPVPGSDPIGRVGSRAFLNGWWDGASRAPAHVGRVGGAIAPWSVVVHTTDMLPDEWAALVNAWTTRPGDGACAHFLIGRDAAHGVRQLVPITRNGNHAGGPSHGVFTDGRRTWHPNLVCVGIELHCAGGVRRIDGAWRLVEGGKAHGAPLPDADVIPDPKRPGRGWHRVTDYQLRTMRWLLTDLDLTMPRVPPGVSARATKESPDAWTVMPTARVVTHAQLDPSRRADPWRPTCEWLASLAIG